MVNLWISWFIIDSRHIGWSIKINNCFYGIRLLFIILSFKFFHISRYAYHNSCMTA